MDCDYEVNFISCNHSSVCLRRKESVNRASKVFISFTLIFNSVCRRCFSHPVFKFGKDLKSFHQVGHFILEISFWYRHCCRPKAAFLKAPMMLLIAETLDGVSDIITHNRSLHQFSAVSLLTSNRCQNRTRG